MKKNKIIFSVLTCILAPLFFKYSFAMSEKEKIRYLLHEIEISGYTFIRNGSKYTSQKARAHLEYKFKRAGRSIKTAEDFISKIASKSSFSGKPYYIRMDNGTLIKTGEWLRKKLSKLVKSLKAR